MKSSPRLFVVLLSLVCSGCDVSGRSPNDPSSAAETPKKIEPIRFQNLTFPGTRTTAKAEGFTDCKHEYTMYRCTRKEPMTLYGVRVKEAFVKLTASDAFTQGDYSASSEDVTSVAPETLSYRSVHLSFEVERDLDPACMKKYQKKPGEWGSALIPEECMVPTAIQAVEEQLRANGWREKISSSAGPRYYKDHEYIEIGVDDGKLEFKPLNREEAMEKWTALRADKAKEENAKAQKEDAAVKSDAFIKSMKSE